MYINTQAKRGIGSTFPRLIVAPKTGCLVLAISERDGVILRKADPCDGIPVPVGHLIDITGEWTDYLGEVTLSNDG